jgi:uncharacterized Zn finger protein
VYYLLGDRFSEDPFVLFQLRGRTREQIIETLRQIRANSTPKDESSGIQDDTTQPPPSAIPHALNLNEFWHYANQLEPSLVVIAPPPSSETVLDVLGAIPLKTEEPGSAANAAASQAIMDYLKTVYQSVSQQALLTAMNAGGEG